MHPQDRTTLGARLAAFGPFRRQSPRPRAPRRFRTALAVAAILASTLGIAQTARAEIAVEGARIAHEPRAIRAIVEDLEAWIDVHTDLPRAAHPPQTIVLIESRADMPAPVQTAHLGDRIRGLYAEDTARIYLMRPWYGDSAEDRSVLLHELIHHRQVSARHWYCPQAMEWDAYLIQEDYLRQHGRSGGFNWAWVALASSCTTGEHHPG